MRYSQIFILSSFLAAALVLVPVSAKCQSCNLNGIACISDKSFHICYKGRPDTSQSFDCPTGNVCVADDVEICLPNAAADCSKQHNICGVCDGTKPFTCLSSTTFVQCNNKKSLRNINGSCPSGLTCDSSKPEICVVGGAECS